MPFHKCLEILYESLGFIQTHSMYAGPLLEFSFGSNLIFKTMFCEGEGDERYRENPSILLVLVKFQYLMLLQKPFRVHSDMTGMEIVDIGPFLSILPSGPVYTCKKELVRSSNLCTTMKV